MLQAAVNRLVEVSKLVNLEVNSEKTKWMKFRRGGRVPQREGILVGNRSIDCVSSYTYLGLAITSTAKSFTKHIRERTRKALITVMSAIKNPRVLSIDTCLELFKIKIAPIASYGIEVIWEHCSLRNLRELDKVYTLFLKRALSVSKSSKNRLVYKLVGTPSFIEYVAGVFSLPQTTSYNAFLAERQQKFELIEQSFFATQAMRTDEWKGAMQARRHVATRYAVHGFHFLLCTNSNFHEPCGDCVCVYCKHPCSTYHFSDCENVPYSLSQLACHDDSTDVL